MQDRARTLAIIQVRMSSRRVPGKVMRTVAGKPLLQYLLERVSRAKRVDGVVVATSDQVEDDLVASHCASTNVACCRGSLTDVAGRFARALEAHPAARFVRISGDSPLIDPQVIDEGIELFASAPCDMVTNVFPRTFPAGQSVEILHTSVFLRTVERMATPEDREHVTPYFYRHSHEFRIRNFTAPRDLSGIHVAVDTHEDMRRFCEAVDRMDAPHWTYRLDEIVELYRQAATEGSRVPCAI